MGKVFEDDLIKIQADMVSICLEYVENRAEKIYIYCYNENGCIYGNCFFKVDGNILEKHNLNKEEYNISFRRQDLVLDILVDDIEKMEKLCKEYHKPIPTEMRLIYDVKQNKLIASYRYDRLLKKDKYDVSWDDLFNEWVEEEKTNLIKK